MGIGFSWLKNSLVALMLVVATSNQVKADFFSFLRVTANASQNVATQLSVEVLSFGSNQVSFTFRNNVGIASSICDVYFDDAPTPNLALPLIITQSAGVNFSQGASPGNLPGGSGVGFQATTGFTADSNPPVAPNGVNAANEWLTITFNLASGRTFSDVIDALTNDSLRIGLHVQAIGTAGKSDSFVSYDNPQVLTSTTPAPPSIVLAAFGGFSWLGTALARRRQA